VIPACIACGKPCTERIFEGAVGPFCSSDCKVTQADAMTWMRANAYASRVIATRWIPSARS